MSLPNPTSAVAPPTSKSITILDLLRLSRHWSHPSFLKSGQNSIRHSSLATSRRHLHLATATSPLQLHRHSRTCLYHLSSAQHFSVDPPQPTPPPYPIQSMTARPSVAIRPDFGHHPSVFPNRPPLPRLTTVDLPTSMTSSSIDRSLSHQ